MLERNEDARKLRRKQTAEVFTPPKLVAQMLSKLPKGAWRKGKTFCDPSCGNGNFLICILWRKICKGHNSLDAIRTIYGVDIIRDNIAECRMRLLKVISLFGEEITDEHIRAVLQNIIWINTEKYPTGSLEYNFEFNNKIRQDTVERWKRWITEENALDQVDLPVQEEVFSPSGKPMLEWGDDWENN